MPDTDTAPKPTPPPTPNSSTSSAPPLIKPKEKRGPGRPPADDKLAEQVAQNLGMVLGLGMVVAGEPVPGSIARDLEILTQHCEPLAAALVKVSKTNPALRKALQSFTATGAYSELMSVGGMIVLAILANHGALPAQFGAMFGGPVPESDAGAHAA